MIVGEWKSINIANTGNISGEVDLGRQYEALMAVVPTIDIAQLSIQVAEKTGGTFQDLYVTEGDGTSAKVLSDAGTGALSWVVPIGGFQFIKLKVTNAQTANRSFRVCGARS